MCYFETEMQWPQSTTTHWPNL